MEYLNNHEGSFQNSHLRIPSTFNHVTQFLYHVKDEDWLHFQNSARDALEGKVQFPVKIKPSSLRLVHKSRAVELVKPLIDWPIRILHQKVIEVVVFSTQFNRYFKW